MSRWSAACLALLAVAAAPPAASQDGGDSVPRLADGHPDLSGVWWGGADVGGPGFRPGGPRQGEQAPKTFTDLYQPWAKERAAQLSDADDPTLNCVPTAFGTLNVRLWDVGAVGQIIATPKFVVLLSETFHGYQIVPTDGRPHRDDVPPSWRGDAVGHWEGDTFVVETKNFTDDTWIWAEGRVSFHSDALRIVERYRRVDADTLVIDATVYDPKVLVEPWVVPTQTLELAPFDQLLPLNCSGTETRDLAVPPAAE
ncbi:MAG TPA: hypothetical protein VF322_00355 [Gammaproteobacteria bacterium]